jgi:heptose I phosphotransferase
MSQGSTPIFADGPELGHEREFTPTPEVARRIGPGTLWQRLVRGMRRFDILRADWNGYAGENWSDYIMQAEVTDDFHQKQGRSTGRWIVKAAGKQLAVYLKRHYALPRWRGWMATLWPSRNWSPAMQEYHNLKWARTAGLLVPKVVVAGEYVGPWGKLQSFLAIEELTDMVPLHWAIPRAKQLLDPRSFCTWKKGLVRELARLARFLHDRNYFHKDLYLCHFFIARADIHCVPTWTNRVFMIDFHRLAHHPITGAFWISKDLGQLLYSSGVEGITARDRLRFWRVYLGARRNSLRGRVLRRFVLMRERLYRKHNAKRALKKG